MLLEKPTAFISAKTTQAWLSQFDVADQESMLKMLRAMRLVSRDEFAESEIGDSQCQHEYGEEFAGECHANGNIATDTRLSRQRTEWKQ